MVAFYQTDNNSSIGSGQATMTGDLQGGTYGVTWVIDPTQTPVAATAAHERR
jgi:hypothetical protein